MEKKKQYPGLDMVKLPLAILVAARHVIQIYYPEESKWRIVIGAWLSNLAVPVFFTIAGFFLFRKVKDRETGFAPVRAYCVRILRLYLLWCVIYWPIDFLNWYHGNQSLGEYILYYIQSLLFDSTIVQLWYLPALLVACLLVWFFYSRGMKVWQMALVTGALFCCCWICDNWYFNQKLPMKLQELLALYFRYFKTTRNGLFYGPFFVFLGFWFSRTERKIPFWPAALASGFFVLAMYWEVTHYYNVNIVLSSAPAAFFIFAAASAIRLQDRKIYPRMRAMSEWVYLAHFYFMYFYAWTSRWNPLPATKKGITVSILGPLLLFSGAMVLLSEKERFKGLRKLI